jgi:hypothetical protein
VAGFQPKIECLIEKATADDKHFFGIGMCFPAESRCVGSGEEAGQPGVFAGDGVEAQGQLFGDSFQSFDRRPLSPVVWIQGIPVRRG